MVNASDWKMWELNKLVKLSRRQKLNREFCLILHRKQVDKYQTESRNGTIQSVQGRKDLKKYYAEYD